MLFDLVDILQKKRRLLFVVAFISIDFWLMTLCSQSLQAHRSGLATRIHNYQASSTQGAYQSDTPSGNNLADNMSRTVNAAEAGALRTTIATADDIVKAKRGLQIAAKATIHGLAVAIITTVHAIGFVVKTIVHIIFDIIIFICRVIAFPFIAIGHGIGHLTGAVSGLTHGHLASVIHPQSGKNVPVITAQQAQQASLIQKDTLAVTPVKPTGAGGACDSGAGNGGYPMDWCDARMDSVQTVSYSGDPINRECTSYAFWYFTTIEGHTDFHVTGNANRWTRTSNYATHDTPAVGAIAVETGGYYGHVAIVQALPNTTYDSKVVPDGYVLVSEMNYDWQGHFRYSYSPLGKFAAYIYR